MKDRVSLYPGRVLITPEDGSPAFYATMTRADEPTQAGDPLNKATFLSDSVAAMYGFDDATVPNDLFGYVGEYIQHQWFRKVVSNFVVGLADAVSVVIYDQNSGGMSSTEAASRCHYYNTVELDPNHVPILPSGYVGSAIVTYNQYTDATELIGHYILKNDVIYYVDTDAKVSRDNGGRGYRTLITAKPVIAVDQSAPGPDTYLRSSDKNAYPISGEVDGYAYTYLGRSIKHVLREPVRVVAGTYYGTGLFGSVNQNRLEFPFKKLLALFVVSEFDHKNPMVYLGQPGNSVAFTDTGNALDWYADSVDTQYNEENTFYYYVAVGIDSDRKEN